MKQFIKDYFSFSKKERITIFILLILILAVWQLPYFFSANKTAPKSNPELEAVMQQIENKQHDSSANFKETKNDSFINKTENHLPLFVFDPNTLDADGWKKLGIKERTVKTILNYRSKGGQFRKPEDISKIWGLKKEEAERLIPYANIAGSFAVKNNYSNPPKATKQEIHSVDINLATAQDFMQLPGMDRTLPYRIIHFREKLGGFINQMQVKETYGISDSVFKIIYPFLTIQNVNPRKLNVNSATEAELNSHPYITRDIAKAIVLYRSQHGNYQQLTDIKKIIFISENIFVRISPYLTIN